MRGFYKAAIDLYENYFSTNNIDVSNTIRPSTTGIKRELEQFITNFMSSKTQPQNISPAIQWA